MEKRTRLEKAANYGQGEEEAAGDGKAIVLFQLIFDC